MLCRSVMGQFTLTAAQTLSAGKHGSLACTCAPLHANFTTSFGGTVMERRDFTTVVLMDAHGVHENHHERSFKNLVDRDSQ